MDIIVRAVIGFVVVFLLLRLMGRRELSTQEPFDLIMLVVVGDLIQQGITQSDQSLTGSILTVGTFGLLTVGFSYFNFRFKRLRPILEAEPLILIQDGKPVEKNLRHERLTVEEVAAEARLQQLASLNDVEWAVLEGSGKISFIPKA